MHKRCKCGFMMSDVLSSNQTQLDLYFAPVSDADSDYWRKPRVFVFHCECCHRLYLFRHGKNQRSYVLALTDVIPSACSAAEADFEEMFFLLLDDDKNKVFKAFWSSDRKRMLLEYHDKTAVFSAESIYEENDLVYQHDYPVKLICDELSADRSIDKHHIRCPCGWMIAQEYCDCESSIVLYDEEHWKMRVGYELGQFIEPRKRTIAKGLCCEKCSRLMLPDENGKYIVYKPITAHNTDMDSAFSFLSYYVRDLDEGTVAVYDCFNEYESSDQKNIDDCIKYLDRFHKIFISEDKKYLRVHIGDTVVYYQAEKDE